MHTVLVIFSELISFTKFGRRHHVTGTLNRGYVKLSWLSANGTGARQIYSYNRQLVRNRLPSIELHVVYSDDLEWPSWREE